MNFGFLMNEIFLMDYEELFFLAGSILSLLLTCCYTSYFIKLLQKRINFIDIPIISLFFCYLNNYVFFAYSKFILHDSMNFFYFISTIISAFLIILYLIIEFNKEKVDSILNILFFIAASLSIDKLLFKELNHEDKIKICCNYSTYGLLFGFMINIYRAIHIKSNNILNLYIGIILIFLCGCYYGYGFYYKEIQFIYPNLIGILFGFFYIALFQCLKSKYSKDFGGADSVIDIDNKNENEEGKDSKK